MRIKLLVAILLFAAAFCSAKNHARADVTMKDGAVKENVEIKLPKGWDNKITIKSGNVEETLKAETVDHFVLWHDENPEDKTVIIYTGTGEFKHKKNKYESHPYKGWMTVYSAGENMAYLIWFNKIKLNAKGIKFEIDDKSHYFLKKGEEYAIRIPINLMQPSRTRDWLKAFLSDDSEIVEKISEKGYFNKKKPYHQGNNYNPFFFEDIAEDYNPKR